MHRYMIRYSKKDPARYTAHLDLIRELERSMRRAKLPVAFSEGFNPHPRMSIAAPLPVGTEGLAELAEVEMTREVEPVQMVESLNAVLPPGLKVLEVAAISSATPALMAALERADYIVRLDGEDLPAPLPNAAIQEFMTRDCVEIRRRGKDGKEKIRDIRPGIVKVEVLPAEDGLCLRMELKTGSVMNVRPAEAITALFEHAGIKVDPADLQITRTGLFLAG